MRNNKTGFTLVELLIALFVLQLILVIGYYNAQKATDYSFTLWYEQFELDILYLQKHTMNTSTRYVLQFYPENNYYQIKPSPVRPAIIHRDLPPNWKVTVLTLGNPLSFAHTGQIRQPGTIKVETKDEIYFIYFPFGKGRSYYVKNQ